jgi:hypothetical protein
MPRTEQLTVPAEYGSPATLLDWSIVDRRLADAPHYWLVTVKRSGRPHVVAIDGLWIDGRLYFGGSPTTVWQRSLRADPNVTVHLDDSRSAVILEGACQVEEPGRDGAAALVAASNRKYGYAAPASAYLAGVWAFTPSVGRAWTDLTVDATRYVFDAL